MKIPTSFELLGQHYIVRIISRDQWKDPEAIGLFDSNTKEIHILKNSPQGMVQTYLHELAHAMLLAMGRDRLYKDEAFVDLLGSMLQQVFKSAQYR